MKEIIQIIQQVKELQKTERKFVLATVVQVDGSAYRRPGARMLISEEGDWWGGIS
jgi:xanthine/CO dehydrogenase XdhC/CoxF family maturation factor